ncbi:unnamed protein product [Schistosoma curassoni]|uniref:Uncharacterized protein n=1 Tax=Schistosoma curassoni TaxID=6186 RepID=A0A183JL50_9TREM|nr:unnamed protein product [Schistosoma curassoni]
MQTLPPASTGIQHRQVAPPRELSTCSHIFIRVDLVRKPLQQPYEGPFHVIARHEKTFKTEHVDDSALLDNLRPNFRPIKPDSGISTPTSDPTLDTSETSFSRPGQQHVSSAPCTDEASVSRLDQQNTPPLTSDDIAGSRSTNEIGASCSGHRVRLPVRTRD